MSAYIPIERRLEKGAIYGGEDECWPWIGIVNKKGYGLTRDGVSRSLLTGRLIGFTKGQSQKELCVCHSCDNPSCINPKHLWLGVVGENNKDRHAKGRSRGGSNRGKRNPRAKITAEMAIAIAKSSESYAVLGKKYGLHWGAVRDIKKGINWWHVTGLPRRIAYRDKQRASVA